MSRWPVDSDRRHGPLPLSLLVLTVVTGVVDAVSILRLGRVFVANMTGNVVFTGFALVGAPGFSLSASLSALVGFLVAAALYGVLARRIGGDRALLSFAAGCEVVLSLSLNPAYLPHSAGKVIRLVVVGPGRTRYLALLRLIHRDLTARIRSVANQPRRMSPL